MSKLKIWTIFEDQHRQFLQTPATDFDLNKIDHPESQKFFKQLLETMKHGDGIGLAATQVGQSTRVAAIAGEVGMPNNENTILVNPKIVSASPTQVIAEEGCLSVPKVFGLVPRSQSVEVMYFDYLGNIQKHRFSDLAARVVQHEIDHLNGILFITKVNKITQRADLLK